MNMFSRSNIVIDKPAGQPVEAHDFIQLETIFGLLPTVIFYVKDEARRWVTCNQAALNLLRKQDISEIFGAREEDFFPAAVASAIRADDETVLKQGATILDRVELIANEYGELVWVKTSKLPIQNKQDAVIGLVGITQVLDLTTELPQRFEKFRTVMKMIDNSLDAPPPISDLAAVANMSESHFRRSFKQSIGVAPQEFITQQRLRKAAKLLIQSDMSIAKVALDCGFGDQSHFSRQFGKFFGETPRQYRLHWR